MYGPGLEAEDVHSELDACSQDLIQHSYSL